MGELEPDMIVRCVCQCLHVCGQVSVSVNRSMSGFMADYKKHVQEGMPQFDRATLPEEMSAKFRACTNIADTVKQMGFPDELGFQGFLYPNEKVRACATRRAYLRFLPGSDHGRIQGGCSRS